MGQRCLQGLLLLVAMLVCSRTASGYGRGSHRSHKEHHHYKPNYKDQDANLLQEASLLQDKEHLQEDFKEYYNLDLSEDMSEEELEFYYFQLHDTDQNGYLDGLEILTALNHILDDPNDDGQEDPPANTPRERVTKQRKWNEKFEQDAVLVDTILKQNDINEDGYVSYLEFAINKKSEERKSKKN